MKWSQFNLLTGLPFTSFQLLASKDRSSVNNMNMYGETALHLACLHRMSQSVEMLLRWGADPTLTMSQRYPIHCAMKAESSQ